MIRPALDDSTTGLKQEVQEITARHPAKAPASNRKCKTSFATIRSSSWPASSPPW